MHHSPSEFCKNLIGRFELKGFPRLVVEFLLDDIDVVIGYERKVCSFGEESSNESVRIFNGTFLPGAVRITVIGVDAIIHAELPVVGSFASAVKGDAFEQSRREVGDLGA